MRLALYLRDIHACGLSWCHVQCHEISACYRSHCGMGYNQCVVMPIYNTSNVGCSPWVAWLRHAAPIAGEIFRGELRPPSDVYAIDGVILANTCADEPVHFGIDMFLSENAGFHRLAIIRTMKPCHKRNRDEIGEPRMVPI